ncbi:MucBP domain-containing protein [Bifidobacterium aemilianum]|uniref:MucBP domain-containing protein n=1 Tax=Bifidobacterium aemilianum TaxID=2493120 RepID=UPI001374EB85|nr:MucBP domain-containing protein [Bifidobacterium aemilianum]
MGQWKAVPSQCTHYLIIPFSLSAPAKGRNPSSAPVHGSYSDKPQTIIYTYTRTAGQAVTIHYVDQHGANITDESGHAVTDTSVNGNLGDVKAIDTTAPVAGWEFVSGPSSGTVTDRKQDLNPVYQRAVGAPVTVHYQDQQGHKLTDALTLGQGGRWGDHFQATHLSIQGWTFDHAVGDESGSLTGSAQEVTMIYRKAAGQNVTVHYLGDKNQKLADDSIISGNYGDGYDLEPIAIKGWEWVRTEGDSKGHLDGSSHAVSFIYQRAMGGAITIHYQDEQGKAPEVDSILTGPIGTAYETKPRSIQGWVLIDSKGQTKGSFTDQAQTVMYVYQKKITPADQQPSTPDNSNGANSNDSSPTSNSKDKSKESTDSNGSNGSNGSNSNSASCNPNNGDQSNNPASRPSADGEAPSDPDPQRPLDVMTDQDAQGQMTPAHLAHTGAPVLDCLVAGLACACLALGLLRVRRKASKG